MSPNSQAVLPVTLCMTNHNGARYLEASLGAVFAQEAPISEIIFVDNASSDKSVEIVKERFSAVTVIQMPDNRGPGAARNAGFRAASNNLILFLDNDVILDADCSKHLVGALNDHPKAIAAVPRVLYAQNKTTIQYDGADCHFLGLMILRNADRPISECSTELMPIDSLVSACVLFDRSKWGVGDPFDETFIFNYEDHDFGVRLRILGHDILSVPTARTFHWEGTEGLSFRPGRPYPRSRIYFLVRNRWQIIVANYAFKTIMLFLPAFLIYEAFQFVGVLKKGWLREWLQALLWMVKHVPQVLQKRKSVQANRKTPDREILQNGPLPFTKELTTSVFERMGKNLLDVVAARYWKIVEKLV
jgi:GT2 family glycosyltransferase